MLLFHVRTKEAIMDVLLDGYKLHTHVYREERKNGNLSIKIEFRVSSEDYHSVTTKLYEGSFFVEIPEKELAFKGRIKEYSTSITNLYVKGQEGNFLLVLEEFE